MTDREKVIKSLETCSDVYYGATGACSSCSFSQSKNCFAELVHQTIALLKEQDRLLRKREDDVNKLCCEISGLKHRIHDKPELVRCKDCKHRPKEPNWETYESGGDIEFPEGSKCPCQCSVDRWYSWYPEDDWFCADGERRDKADES